MAVVDAMGLLKADGAKAGELGVYKKALAALGAHCQEGTGIAFSVDTMATAAHMNRLSLVESVTSQLGGKTNVDCTSAVLDVTSGTPLVISTDSSTPVTYLLGDASTAKAPAPACSLGVANWTAALGPVVVTVSNVRGPTTISVTITETNGANVVQVAPIVAGQEAHDFQFAKVVPSTVAKVLVTATQNDNSKGGSCVATGSPKA